MRFQKMGEKDGGSGYLTNLTQIPGGTSETCTLASWRSKSLRPVEVIFSCSFSSIISRSLMPAHHHACAERKSYGWYHSAEAGSQEAPDAHLGGLP